MKYFFIIILLIHTILVISCTNRNNSEENQLIDNNDLPNVIQAIREINEPNKNNIISTDIINNVITYQDLTIENIKSNNFIYDGIFQSLSEEQYFEFELQENNIIEINNILQTITWEIDIDPPIMGFGGMESIGLLHQNRVLAFLNPFGSEMLIILKPTDYESIVYWASIDIYKNLEEYINENLK